MTDRNMKRRTILGSLGIAGAGAALGGVGTQAFFSDQETFTDNQLVAGSLDMKVDWEEHYSDWSDDEGEGVDWRMINNSDELLGDEHGFPQLRNGTIAVNETDVDQFMNNTAIEAFPDENGDNLVDRGGIACQDFGDAPEDLAAPVISLDDVKPGDFGEVTFSFHLCDNPGYVWMNGNLIADDEVSVNEPEADDPDEDDTPDGTYLAGSGELAESVQAAVWYDDDCDNVLDESVGSADVVMAVDRSGSISDDWDDIKLALENAIEDFNGPDNVGIVFFGSSPQAVDWSNGNDEYLIDVSTNRQTIADQLPDDPPPTENGTHMAGGLDFANWILDNQGTSDTQAIILFTDGDPNYQNGTVGDGSAPPDNDTDFPATFTYSGGTSSWPNSNPTQSEADETEAVADAAKADGTMIVTVGLLEDDTYLRDQIATSPSTHFATENPEELDNIYSVVTQLITTREKVLCTGSLREVLDELNTNEGRGLPLDAARDEIEPGVYDYDEKNDPENDEDRQCYPATTTACVAFEWWLPLDHANEIQTDRAEFDLGFYTEQCRHNDGAGMIPEGEAGNVPT
jgi:predicted ribosomally synthesized peptide with SipW-like signal peptide